MIIVVNKNNKHRYTKELASMHHLRKKVFKDSLKWNVNIINEMEFDQFDTDDAYYIMHISGTGDVDGCTRLLPTTKPYLLGDVFPQLIENQEIPCDESIWESTRFCADKESAPKDIMPKLLSAMLEFALANGIKEYVSVSDVRIEPLLRRSGWETSRLGATINTGTDIAVGKRLPVTGEIFENVKSKYNPNISHVISNLAEMPINSQSVGVA